MRKHLRFRDSSHRRTSIRGNGKKQPLAEWTARLFNSSRLFRSLVFRIDQHGRLLRTRKKRHTLGHNGLPAVAGFCQRGLERAALPGFQRHADLSELREVGPQDPLPPLDGIGARFVGL